VLKIPPTQITLPLAQFAEVSRKSERQIRKDLKGASTSRSLVAAVI
jgi:hypothetical protein